MSLEFQFETFVDVYHSIFSEYLSSVIAKLPKPDHYELQLDNDQKLKFTTIPLLYGKDIGVELSDLEFDDVLGLPIKFSSEIKYYESE